MKKIFASIAISLMMIAPAQALTVTNPYDLFADDTIMLYELQLSESLRTKIPSLMVLLDGLIKSDTELSISKSTAKLFANKVKAGNRIYLGMAELQANEMSVITQITPEEWTGLTANAEPTDYKGASILNLEEERNDLGAIGYVGNYLVAAGNLDFLQNIIDKNIDTAGKMLGRDPEFKQLKDALPEQYALFMMIGVKDIFSTMGLENELGQFEYLDLEGITMNETPTGYVMDAHVIGNPKLIAEQNLSLNPGGDFTPSMAQHFPNLAPILYYEGFNLKANIEQAKKTYMGTEISVDKMLKQLEKESKITFSNLLNAMTRGHAFAVQYTPDQILPYVSFVADVTSNRASAEEFTKTLTTQLTKELGKLPSQDSHENVPVIDIRTVNNGLTEIHFKFPWLNYKFNTTLMFGVTDSGYFVFTNYQWINGVVANQSLAQQSDYLSFASKIKGPVMGLMYLNMRNVWALLDIDASMFSLKFTQGYHALVNKIYAWKDLSMVMTGTTNTSNVHAEVTVDTATYPTFSEFAEKLSKKDSDNDKVNDYDEQFIYRTDVKDADCDNDGADDQAEIKLGNDPCGGGNTRFFQDVGRAAYYTEGVSVLKQNGIVNGYGDGLFHPEREVNRAEFVAMVMAALHSSEAPLAPLLQNSYSPFDDVRSSDWFAPALSEAARAGIVTTSHYNFRPSDPITRAEAVVILSRAAKVLSQLDENSSADLPFDDVARDQWFTEPIVIAHQKGIIKGKSQNSFDPMGHLLRADAATLIHRVMKLEFSEAKNDNGGTFDLFNGSF
ncbi:S-layer homology domain-containing protein [Candidatus Gracilibacteria bacterium]|nr:S-layer homology domain-containing protein [Candidatus Gracilibacteria bacterium]